jgi:hypothetical protein
LPKEKTKKMFYCFRIDMSCPSSKVDFFAGLRILSETALKNKGEKYGGEAAVGWHRLGRRSEKPTLGRR